MKFGGECVKILNNSERVELFSPEKVSLTPFGVKKRLFEEPRISFGAIHVQALSGFLTFSKRCGVMDRVLNLLQV
jgi:hypothetical protein